MCEPLFLATERLTSESESESEVAELCPTLCNPVDCSLPGFSIHGILQARILEWVTISLSRGSSQPRDRTRVSLIGGRRFNLWATREAPNHKFILLQMIISKWNCWVAVGCVCVCVCMLHMLSRFSRVWLFVTPWTVAHQAPLSLGFSRQEYWSGLPFPSPGDLSDPGIEPRSPAL